MPSPPFAFGLKKDDALSDSDFRRLTTLARDVAGLTIPESKRTMIQSRLLRRLRSLGHRDIPAYLASIDPTSPGDELQAFISILTTNVSSFFRERHHFDALARDILPGLLARAEAGERIRFWSAGCSAGQEAYSLAITILQLQPDAHRLDLRVLGTDIDCNVLRSAQMGRYSVDEIDHVPPRDQAAFFDADADVRHVRVSERVRSMVTFRQLNIHDNWPMRGTFDAIFCRNVVIYFDGAAQSALWPRFRARLASDGRLYLGHSERIADPEKLGFVADGVTTYRPRRRGGATRS